MAFFDSLRDKLTGGTKPKSYEVVFKEPKMGMTLTKGPRGEAVVTGVAPGGPAARNNVRDADIVYAINGQQSPSYHDLVEVIGAVGRPVSVIFHRAEARHRGSETGGGGGGGDNSGSAGNVWSQAAAPFQRAQDAARRKMDGMKPQPPRPSMTPEERAAQREAALKAADARQSDWNKRLNKGRQASQARAATTNEAVDNKFEESNNAETRRMVELAKEQEARTAAEMGYNPFEPRLMGNNVARAAISGGETGGGVSLTTQEAEQQRAAAGAAAAGGGAGPRPSPGEGEQAAGREDEGWANEDPVLLDAIGAEIEERLGIVLEQGQGASSTAVQTMLKMMRNMAANAHEDKFKRIRLGNKTFESKVGSVDGALDVMISAGFKLETQGDEPVLQHGPCDPLPLTLRIAMHKLGQAEKMLSPGGGDSDHTSL